MRGGIILSGLTLAIGVSSLPAFSAGVIGFPYEGLLAVETVTAACGQNVLVDDNFPALYAPIISGFNSPPGVIHLYKQRQAVRMEDAKAAGQFRGSGNYNGTQLTGRGTFVTFSGTYSGNVVLPKTITPGTTEFITMTGTITNFDNRAGCTVGFRASFEARAS